MQATDRKIIIPTTRLPDAKVADAGKVRLGDATITGVRPVVRRADAATSDTGKVRLGDATITGCRQVR